MSPSTKQPDRTVYERKVYMDAHGRSVVGMTTVPRGMAAMFIPDWKPSVSFQVMCPLPEDAGTLPVTAPATCESAYDVFDWMDTDGFKQAAQNAFNRLRESMRKQAIQAQLESSAGLQIPPGARH